MKLDIIGCSGTLPREDSGCSSYLFEAEGFRLLVDAGSGSSAHLLNVCDFDQIDAVLLTHMHGDHWLDLVLYTYIRRYDPVATATPLPVYAPQGAEEIVKNTLDWSTNEFAMAAYDFRELGTGTMSIGPFTVVLTRTAHPVETYAVRIEHGGRSVTYSADTGECRALVNLARNTDLFLCEAALGEEEVLPGIHLTATQAAQHAKDAGVARLVLTHLRPWASFSEVSRIGESVLGRPVELARTGAQYTFG